ncbi:MAG: NADH-quinone oxidoreductase subunit C [Candidatus Aenigmatarchaeota archaeon]|nr:MAG: NADH-quinone oxidoreductase subunit C [Candidatus Aenigmarchaeota archaeon]HDJ99955.1 NADH-quinone oxidoreductase subunit C [Bacillota bacterium]
MRRRMKMEKELKKRIKKIYKNTQVEFPEANRMVIKTKQENLLPILEFLKNEGFRQLKAISCVDWIEEKEFELIYHLSSLNSPLHIMVKVRIGREDAQIETIIKIFGNAQIYEREIHELFGVKFRGNPNLSPLFLENWQSIPPFRKDFDTREYVKKKFGEIPFVEEKK